jgi:hypothetical protein
VPVRGKTVTVGMVMSMLVGNAISIVDDSEACGASLLVRHAAGQF